LLDDNRSIAPIVAGSLAHAWRRALIEAEKETGGFLRRPFP